MAMADTISSWGFMGVFPVFLGQGIGAAGGQPLFRIFHAMENLRGIFHAMENACPACGIFHAVENPNSGRGEVSASPGGQGRAGEIDVVGRRGSD